LALKKSEGRSGIGRIIDATTNKIMKKLKTLTAAVLAVSTLTAPLAGLAADQNTETKPKPYTLKTCVVSGEKLGEMGKPVVYVHEGREFKFCCKDCVKDFKKDPAKYVKKLEQAEAKAKKQG
jgi:YHS domain-containing protein